MSDEETRPAYATEHLPTRPVRVPPSPEHYPRPPAPSPRSSALHARPLHSLLAPQQHELLRVRLREEHSATSGQPKPRQVRLPLPAQHLQPPNQLPQQPARMAKSGLPSPRALVDMHAQLQVPMRAGPVLPPQQHRALRPRNPKQQQQARPVRPPPQPHSLLRCVHTKQIQPPP